MDITNAGSLPSLGATAAHGALFTTDELIGALEEYEDLPLDLILDGSAELELSPLDVPPTGSPSGSSATNANTNNTASPASTDDSNARVPRSQQVRIERSFLEHQISLLERELSTIKRSTQPPAPTSTLWRDVAKRQRARRTEAERENEVLRAKLLRQIQVAKSLQVVLHRREECDESKTIPQNQDAWMDDLGHVLRRFAVDIEHAYGAVDVVLPLKGGSPRLDGTPLNNSVVRTHTELDGAEQLYVETTQAYVLPFSLDQVASVAWHAFTTHFERQRRQLELYCSTNDLFACKFAGSARLDELTQDSLSGLTAATVIARSYHASDGSCAVVSRAFIAPNNGTLREALAVSTGWIVFRSFQDNPQFASAHVCIRTVPKKLDIISLAQQSLVRLPSTDNAYVATFTSQKLCTTAEDIMSVMEEVENILLDASSTTTAIK